MARTRYKWDGEKMVEISPKGEFVSESPFVLGDTMEPIKDFIEGKTWDSRSQYTRYVKKHGCEIVGNDLLSNKKQVLRDDFKESKVLDAVEYAESILSNPDKRREAAHRQERLFEERAKLLGIR